MKINRSNFLLNKDFLTKQILGIVFIILLYSCSQHRAIVYTPGEKLSPTQMQKDFSLLQKIIEQEHPSVYWYSSKEEMDEAFAVAKKKLNDSLTELQFKNIIGTVVSKIKCGHTSVRSSKGFEKWINKANLSYFPFGMRLYNDTMVVTYNLYRKDTLLPRGTLVKSINGVTSKKITDSLFTIISTDGNGNNFKNVRISNNFPYYYLSVFDSTKKYTVEYVDSLGQDKSITFSDFKRPPPDTTKLKVVAPSVKKTTKKQLRELKRNQIRRLVIDTLNATATLTVNSFSGAKQKKYFKKSFQKINHLGIKNLIVDVRNNGGGIIANSTALTKYIVDHKFKIADSVFAKRKMSRFNQYIKNRFWFGLSMLPLTTKKEDGNYHFTWFQKHHFTPNMINHFNGNVYIIIGGYSFSATTLFVQNIKGQKNVTVVGEETGGGSYGNSAVYIPELTLPNSKIRIRMPVFRVVVSKNLPKTGRGIAPDIYVPPTLKTLHNGEDNKMDKVIELIKSKKS